MVRPVASPALLLLVVTAGAGCLETEEPLIHVTNHTRETVQVVIVIRDVLSTPDAEKRFEDTFRVAPGASGEAHLQLKGTFNVTAFVPGGPSTSREMIFWWGGLLGGQMYAWVTVEEGRISHEERHAD